MQWCVVQKVIKGGYMQSIVVSVICAGTKQQAVEMAKKGWIWTDDEEYEVDFEVQRLFHQPVQVIDHIQL